MHHTLLSSSILQCWVCVEQDEASPSTKVNLCAAGNALKAITHALWWVAETDTYDDPRHGNFISVPLGMDAGRPEPPGEGKYMSAQLGRRGAGKDCEFVTLPALQSAAKERACLLLCICQVRPD